jgi:hypothetical protein
LQEINYRTANILWIIYHRKSAFDISQGRTCVLVVCDVFTQSVNVLRRILQQLNRNEATGTGQYQYQLVRMNVILLPVQSTVHGVRHLKATLLNAQWISTEMERSPWKYRWCYYAINKRQINVTISIWAHAHIFKSKGGDSVGERQCYHYSAQLHAAENFSRS